MKPGEIYRTLKEALQQGDFEDICFELHVRYDHLPGAALPDKIRALVEYMNRRNKMAELVAAVNTVRDDIHLDAPAASENGSWRADQYRYSWTCDMVTLTDKMQWVARKKQAGLVGCTVSCSPTTDQDGVEKALENLCQKSKSLLVWDNICHLDGVSKLGPNYDIEHVMESIRPQIIRLQQRKNVFFRLQLHESMPTSETLTNFWTELQKVFNAKLGQDLDKLQTVFIVVMGSCPENAAFPPGADIHYLGELNLTTLDLDNWMYQNVSVKSKKWTDPRWDKSISTKWAEHIAAYSKLQQRLSFKSIDTHMQMSLEILDNSQDGESFLSNVTRTFS